MNSSKKMLAAALSAAMALSGVTVMSGGASADWSKTADGYVYRDVISGKSLTGWQTIGGGRYYFNKQGAALTGWKIIGRDTYFFNSAEHGKMLTGWAAIGGKRYYFGDDGVMRTGWVTIDGDTYYFTEKGICLHGNAYLIDGAVYSFDESGRLTEVRSAPGYNVLTVTDNVSFGDSTVDEVLKVLPFERKETDGMDIAFAPDDGSMGFYLFNEEGKAAVCMIMFTDISDIDRVRPFFTEAGWLLEDTRRITGTVTEMYVSQDQDIFGFVTSDGGMALAAVGAYDDVDALYYELFDGYENEYGG